MKLLRIETNNLNSLYGTQVVELERQFGAEPLFLITGPTGAGKSTLMDAVSLALFGRTPRLAQGRGDEDQDPRLILSRGTGRGWAVLEFSRLEDARVTRYRATWTVRRAHDKPDGALQGVERMLEQQEADGPWQVLVSSMRAAQYQPHFDRVLAGMTVEDFQRVVLLAQGQFAAFLQATEAERAQILERLTGTEQYLRIGLRASERKKEHETAVVQARMQLDAIQSLSQDEEQRLAAERDNLDGQLQQARQAQTQEQQALGWLQTANTLAGQLAEAQTKLEDAQRAQLVASPQLERLAEHERCAEAAETLRTVDDLIAQQVRLHQQRVEQDQELLLQTAAVADAEPLATAQQQALNSARAHAQVLQPEIGRARATYAQLKSEQHKSKAADAERDRVTQQATAAQQDLATLRQKQAERDAALSAAKQRLEELASSAALVTAAAGLQEQHKQLVGQYHTWQERSLEVQTQASLLAERQQTRQTKLAKRQTLAEQLAPKRDAHQLAADALLAALAGAETPLARRAALRAERDGVQQQLEAANHALRLQGVVADRARQKTDCEADFRQVGQEQERIRTDHAELTSQLHALQADLDQRSNERKALQLLSDLVRERAQLQPGHPCPLCGSPDHPFAEGGQLAQAEAHAVQRCAVLDVELPELERQIKDVESRLQSKVLAQATQQQRSEQLGQTLARLTDELAVANQELGDFLARLGLPAGADTPTLREALLALQGRQAACDQSAHVLDTAESNLQKATDTLQAAEKELTALDQALEVEAAKLQQQQDTLSRSTADVERAAQTLQQQLRVLADRLAGFGIGCPAQLQSSDHVAELDAALLAVAQRAAAYSTAAAALEAATTEATRATSAAEQAAVAVAAAATAAEVAAKAAADQQQSVQQLQAQCQQLLQGRAPDVVEAELAQLLEAAQQAAEAAATTLQQARDALLQTTTERATTEKRLQELAAKLSTHQTELEAALQTLELPDTDALRQRLLPPAELATLHQTRQELAKAKAHAQGMHEVGKHAVEQHAAQRPGELPSDRTVEEQAQLLQEQTNAVDLLNQQLATVIAQLQQDEANRSERERLQKVLADKTKVYAVWQRLHALVGVGDGTAFRKFAQILNLEELAGKANYHLQMLSPRYKLVVAQDGQAAPRLDFAVEDEFQASERRPLTTLSGGETFLVSLSLALALADYRAVKMPIETLLLDEGFGTLDPQTLAAAMSALKTLGHSSGVQVGLISHVETLRHEIPARVVVERQGNGRSVVRTELGL